MSPTVVVDASYKGGHACLVAIADGHDIIVRQHVNCRSPVRAEARALQAAINAARRFGWALVTFHYDCHAAADKVLRHDADILSGWRFEWVGRDGVRQAHRIAVGDLRNYERAQPTTQPSLLRKVSGGDSSPSSVLAES